MPLSSKIQPAALTGFSSSAAYDAHRPTYPPEAVALLLTSLEVAGVKNARIADLAAGTGKFTELLSARPEEFEILAIEPHGGMRIELEKKSLRGVTIVDGTAESMEGVGSGSLAAVVASQSFHWFANKEALREIARVLKPTGVLGMVWNIEDYNAPKSWEVSVPAGWEEEMKNVIWEFDDGLPRFRHEEWKGVFEAQSQGNNPVGMLLGGGVEGSEGEGPLFSLPLGEGSVPFEQTLEKGEVWKRYRTLSQIAVLEGSELEGVERRFRDAVAKEEGEMLTVHGRTFWAWTTRIPGEPLRNGG